MAHDRLKEVYAAISDEVGRVADTEVGGLFGPYPNQAPNAVKKGEMRRVDMVESDPTTGGINMTDNFITDNAGAGASLNNPLRLMKEAEKKKNKKYVDGTGPAGWGFTPLGSGVNGELSEKTFNWLTDAAKAKAKSESSDGMARNSAIARIRWGFQQRLGIALMRAQARMIFNHVLNVTRRKYIDAHAQQRRAANSRGHRRTADRMRGGGRAFGTRAGRGR